MDTENIQPMDVGRAEKIVEDCDEYLVFEKDFEVQMDGRFNLQELEAICVLLRHRGAR